MPRQAEPLRSLYRAPQRLPSPTAGLLRALAASALCAVLAGCGAFFEEKRSPVKPHPLGETYGQMYDEAAYERCHSKDRWDGSCLKLKLRRNDNPEIWPYPDVPPLKWPEAPKESVYREGMTPVEYWRALCKAEAGEFIYRTVEVEGVYEVRPRKHETDYALQDPYVIEDPYGNTFGEEDEELPFHFTSPPKNPWPYALPRYSYIERGWDGKPLPFRSDLHPSMSESAPPGARFRRFHSFDQKTFDTMRMTWSTNLVSTVGFTWRGIRRPMDREMGISGGELVVMDLRTNEILGIRRGFLLGQRMPGGGVGWFGGNACPDYMSMEGPGKILERNKHHNFGLWFLSKVAIPSGRVYSE